TVQGHRGAESLCLHLGLLASGAAAVAPVKQPELNRTENDRDRRDGNRIQDQAPGAYREAETGHRDQNELDTRLYGREVLSIEVAVILARRGRGLDVLYSLDRQIV